MAEPETVRYVELPKLAWQVAVEVHAAGPEVVEKYAISAWRRVVRELGADPDELSTPKVEWSPRTDFLRSGDTPIEWLLTVRPTHQISAVE